MNSIPISIPVPLSLYVHLPWCVHKCPYCDFNSHALKGNLPEESYIEKLLNDLMQDLPRVASRKIHSIFIGGGTPSLFSPEAIKKLLASIRELIAFEKADIEITLEANPGTVERENFNGFFAAGVNRLSIGIQSFQADKLKQLGRIHDDYAALKAVTAAKNAGFVNYNLDLMHGLPTQKITDALYDLQKAFEFFPPHISWYQLTLEPNTLFHHRPPLLPNEEILNDIQEAGLQILKQQNFGQYEVSAYCQPGFECKHNLNYWEFGDYLGIGAGAHGKITDLNTGNIIRTLKIKHPRDYLVSTSSIAGEEIIQKNQLAFEFMLNALRLQKPISWELWKNRTSLDETAILPQLEQLAKRNLIIINSNHFELTTLGKRFLNDVLTSFI